ncbi:hypothetical protein BDF22DRAFT_186764 [Syncephalis plumigaleata]|nr:hypothetical protein BDF22DRAFT_186764 [Syncephalis plumigaleata]
MIMPLRIVCIVKARQHIGSMNSVKTFFTPLKTMEEMEQWIDTLAVELYTRLQDEYEANNRWPSKLSFQYSVGNSETSAHRAYHSSKKVAMISRKELVAPDLLGNRVLRLLREMPEPTPCRGMCLSVGQFKEELDPSMSIKRFFKASTEIAVTTTTTPSPAIATNTIQVPRPASPNLKTQISTRSRVINEFFKGKTTDNHAVLPDTNVIPNDSNDNDNDNDIQDEFTILCEQCGKYISPSEQQEHQDFHLAMSLMEQERNEFRQNANLISRECNNTSANNVSSSSSSSSNSSNSSNSIKKKATTAKRTNSTRKLMHHHHHHHHL